MRKTHKCSHCGASMKRYWHSITPMLAKVLARFYTAILEKKENSLHIPKELNLSKTEYNNFQKLSYHGFAVKRDKPGHWAITQKGVDLIKGRTTVPKRVQTFRGKPVTSSIAQVSISEILTSNPYLERKDDFNYDLA